jgi:hypothetical protein
MHIITLMKARLAVLNGFCAYAKYVDGVRLYSSPSLQACLSYIMIIPHDFS